MESPCKRICALENDVCVGCGRTREEITRWLKMTDAEREEVMNRISTGGSSGRRHPPDKRVQEGSIPSPWTK